MVLSRTTEYALRAMTFLAMQPPGKLTGAREISRAENIPTPFLWKILHMLTRRKLIRSFKGIHGGYELACPGNEITLSTVVYAADGVDLSNQCVLGLPRCDDQTACPLHEKWKKIRGDLLAMLEKNTLADLARVSRKQVGSKRK